MLGNRELVYVVLLSSAINHQLVLLSLSGCYIDLCVKCNVKDRGVPNNSLTFSLLIWHLSLPNTFGAWPNNKFRYSLSSAYRSQAEINIAC